MITTPWENIDSATLQAMCDDSAAESSTLDFKRDAPKTQKADPNNEFAKDVCAFANASGGDLVYGIEEREHGALQPSPFSGEPFDACTRRLAQVLDCHVQPRIVGIRYREVPFADQSYALVVRVPASFDAPHRFHVPERNGAPSHYRFVMRSNTTTLDMDYPQLRDAFGRTAALLDKARTFRQWRIDQFEKYGTPELMARGPKFCIHLVPLAGIARSSIVDVAAVWRRTDIKFEMADGSIPWKVMNIDGVLWRPSPHAEAGDPACSVQLFRSGAMEYVGQTQSTLIGRMGDELSISAFVSSWEIRRVCGQVLEHARALGIEGPATLALTAIDVANCRFQYGQSYGSADRSPLRIIEQLVEEVSTVLDIDTVVRPLLDAYWQGFGKVECEIYDDEGHWRNSL